jgi:hypothetical protein
MKSTAGDWAQIYFITHSDTTWDEAKSVAVPITSDGNFHTYHIDMFQSAQYAGVITQIRLDPVVVSGADISVDYLKAGSPGTRVDPTSFYPDNYLVRSGTYIEGDVSKLRQREFCFSICYNPDDHIKIATATSNPYTATTDFVFYNVPLNSESLQVSCFGRQDYAGAGKTVSYSLYNDSTGLWDVVGTFDAVTEDVMRTMDVDFGSDYVNAAGTVKLRATLTSNQYNSIYHQYVKIIATERLEIPGDMNLDDDVDLVDYAWLTRAWEQSPSYPGNGYLNGADIDLDGYVGMTDFIELAKAWLY